VFSPHNGLITQEIDIEFKQASIYKRGDNIVVNTGSVKRIWRLTAAGLQNVSITNIRTGNEWVNGRTTHCDWEYAGVINAHANAEPITMHSRVSDDSGFTDKHIEFTAEFYYPQAETFVKFQVRVYPGSPGLFT